MNNYHVTLVQTNKMEEIEQLTDRLLFWWGRGGGFYHRYFSPRLFSSPALSIMNSVRSLCVDKMSTNKYSKPSNIQNTDLSNLLPPKRTSHSLSRCSLLLQSLNLLLQNIYPKTPESSFNSSSDLWILTDSSLRRACTS